MTGTIRLFACLLLAVICLSPGRTSAQLRPVLGVQLKPIIPSELFNNTSETKTVGKVDFTVKPQVGFNFGMVFRQAIYKGISLETGITYTQRGYTVSSRDSTDSSASTYFRFVGYEVPILALIYIRLSQNDYIDGAFGFSADFFPSDVGTGTDDLHIVQLTKKKYWILPALTAAAGYEHRTKKSGYFYAGGSYHRMLATMAYTKMEYKVAQPGYQYLISPLSGHYFALDFKYFFPVRESINPEEQNEY